MESVFDNSVLCVRKPKLWTSFDVVNKLKRVSRLKIGHAGTLDPLATGLLILCTGTKTKEIASFQNLEKEYTGIIHLGETTPSFDRETEVNGTFDLSAISELSIRRTSDKFCGKQMQVPPVFSAIKKNGKRAYKKAHRGQHVELEAREVEVYAFQIAEISMPLVHFRICCGKGTYVRSLVHDFGKALGSGACLDELERTRIGHYLSSEAWDIEKLAEAMEEERIQQKKIYESSHGV